MSDTSAEHDVLLRVTDLKVYFETDAGTVRAVDGVSYEVRRGETLALVGESGCGKSVSSMSILRLVPTPPGLVAGGGIEFEGEDLLAADEARMRALRGNRIAMIFQEPMSSLNPVYTVGDQIGESIALHRGLPPEQARAETLELLARVGIPSPERRIDEYPHQMSGGMCQRVMIALALACSPQLLIADEPTTALDVTIQAQIIDQIRELRQTLEHRDVDPAHHPRPRRHRRVSPTGWWSCTAAASSRQAPVEAAVRGRRSIPYTVGLLFHSLPATRRAR